MTRTDAGRPVRSRSTAALVGATAVLAAAVAVVVLALPGSGQRPPSIAGTARLALVAPSAPAPAPAVDARDPYRLAVQASGIPFPNWAPRLVAAAAGHAAAGGRQVQTVLYRSPSGEQVGYAIVSGPPLAPVAGHRASYGGVSYTLARHGPLQIVTWTQHGHTCVIAATSVSAPALLGLAESEA